jgi:uncharacterized protein YecT (DUF1311 family)
MLRFVASSIAVLCAATFAAAEPSFDCAKARGAPEKTVCEVPDLQWNDRQLARFYKLALESSGGGRATVVQSQRAFLARREACGADITCLDAAYKAQFKALVPHVSVAEAFGEFRPEVMGGYMWIVRFGRDAAFKILTIGGGGHTCTFETDSAPQNGKGLLSYAEKGANACRITVIPDGDDMLVQSRNCSEYCGVRAVLDARYRRVP